MAATNQTSLNKLANATIVFIGVGWILHIGSSIILPFVFAIFLAVFLYPVERRMSKIVGWKSLSILLSFLALLIPFLLITILFSMQLISIMESLPSIGSSLESGLGKVLSRISNALPFLNLNPDKLMDTESQGLDGPVSFLGKGFVSTTAFLTSTLLTILYAFFLLYYKNSINNFIIYQFEKSERPDIKSTLSEIKETIQSYIGGVGIVIIILSVLNSIGLTIIGIEYAIFWGTLAGILAVIPFIGTIIGGLLPFLFALSTADANWQPIAVIVYYLIIQQVEGNLITPKIVGDKVDINPLFAIISVIILGTFWGIAGVILALPTISILKIIMSNFDETKAYATLMSTDIKSNKGIFKRLALKKEQA